MADEPKLLAQQPRKILALSAGAGVAVIALTFLAWGLTRPSDDTELAQWFPAVAGALTLIAAVVAAIFAAGAFRLEYRREIRILDDAEQAQAQSFAGWVVRGSASRSAGNDGTLSITLLSPTLHLRNASNLPIYDITAEVRVASDTYEINGAGLPTKTVHLVPPAETTTVNLGNKDFVISTPEGFDGNSPMPRIQFLVDIWFRDTAGRHWHRAADGAFRRNSKPPS